MGPQMNANVDRAAQMKVTGWEGLLAAVVDDARTRSFIWGTHDCATWAFDLRRDLTGGDDTAVLWRGRYRTARGAARVMRRLGWASMSEAGIALLGVPLTNVRLAQRGDLVLSPEATSFGVCLGAQVAFLAPESLTLRALSSCALAWRI